MEFDSYSSHLAVFEKIFSSFNIESVLEFGMGKYSTVFFAERCKLAVSIEQENQQWYEKLSSEIHSPNFFSVFQENPEAVFQYFDEKGTRFDLVFSDGMTNTRCLVANLAMARNVPMVVLHDAEKIWYYRWNLLNIPADYRRFDFRGKQGAKKVTTILTNRDADIVDGWDVPGHERILQTYSSPSQPIIQFIHHGDTDCVSHNFDTSFSILVPRKE